jgi:hypothetical protein
VKKLRIDIDEVQKAMEDTDRDAFDYFLDRETGEVIILSEDIITRAREILDRSYGDDDIGDFDEVETDDVPEIPEWMEDEVELALDIFVHNQWQYVRIPERSPNNAYAAMKAYVEILEQGELKWSLLRTLDGEGSFRKFKDALGVYPKEKKQWFGFNAKTVKKEIREWLQTIGINQEG